jgi:hypothetical protein
LTMLSTRIPSVKDTYFQHKVLTKVHGQPTYESLQTLTTEIKANASSVPSTSGDGTNGHLGMAKEQAVYGMHYDITQPLDTVFNTIEDLADLAEHANSTMSPQQQIDLAYVIFAREPILQQDIRLWNRQPVVDHTWARMIAHFCEAQDDLSSLPVASGIYHQQPSHQANSVSNIDDLVAQRLLDAMPEESPPAPHMVPTAPPEQANALSQRESDLQARESALYTQMQEMLTLMRTTSSTNNTNHNRHPSYNRGRGRSNDQNNDRGRGNQNSARSRKYCWSHGSCAHTSTECNTTAPGHQTAATFSNMLGGSTEGCYWLPT